MKDSARLYYCARCHQQVVICSDCDRGNIYCRGDCSKASRKVSMRAAGRRYQDTLQGRRHHAARQQRYRERQKQKVTHQGSQRIATPSVLASASKAAKMDVVTLAQAQHQHCHCCKKAVSAFLRLNYRHQCSIKPKRINGVAVCGPDMRSK